MTEPNQAFFKHTFDDSVVRILKHYSSYIERAVNYGTNVLTWQGDDSQTELLVTKLFLRYILDTLDGVSILVKSGSADPCKVLLRTAFETSLQLHFIYQKHTKLRADAFWIVDKFEALEELDKLDITTERGKQMRAIFQKENIIKDFGTRVTKEEIKKQKEEIQLIIDNPCYSDVVNEYKSTKSKKNKFYWYSLFEGANNIEGLATQLGKATLYEILYRKWSKGVHGNDIIHEKLIPIDTELAYISTLRLPIGLARISKFACNIALSSFRSFVFGSFPNKSIEYEQWEKTFILEIDAELNHEYISVV